MKGYMMIDTEVFDQEVFAEFAPKIVDAVQAHGGRFLMRGGTAEVIEGDWAPNRIVVMEFDSFERAQAFVRSTEYTSLNDLRSRCMRSSVVVVEGYDGPGS
ncbi:MAG: DUF1330 domain-containing protein [Chloroflexota bacterium]|nr:DUF1330 domain-containing protein [Chloroflexota bacterium]MDE2696633.1 DUF1330 domain-containing protein [Chloroflexota bacterium]